MVFADNFCIVDKYKVLVIINLWQFFFWVIPGISNWQDFIMITLHLIFWRKRRKHNYSCIHNNIHESYTVNEGAYIYIYIYICNVGSVSVYNHWFHKTSKFKYLFFSLFQDHIFKLMKSDSYSRYLRSDQYKEFLSGTRKKVRLLPAIASNFSAFKHSWVSVSLFPVPVALWYRCALIYCHCGRYVV